MPDSKVDDVFVGGMSWQQYGVPMGAGRPFAQLVLRSDGFQLGPKGSWASALTYGFIPTVELPYDALSRVERVHSMFRLSGVRLIPQASSTPTIFWTGSASQVIDAFERRGVAVDRTSHRTGIFGK
jgi:hypothetical protein